jgi:hypothetical protein
MQGQCPRCQVRVDLPDSGTYRCERCAATFQVFLGAPKAAALAGHGAPAAQFSFQGVHSLHRLRPSPPAAPVLVAGVACSTHAGNAAAHVCERCGDFMCELCATSAEGRWYCPRCFDLLYDRGAFQFAQRRFQAPLASLLCAVGAYCGCPILAPAGIYFGVKGLQECAERPDLPGRRMAIAGIVLSALALLGSLAVIVWLVYALIAL